MVLKIIFKRHSLIMQQFTKHTQFISIKFFIIILLFSLISLPLSGLNYYVKNAGDDNNTGLSDAQAWKTITKVNSVAWTFKPGDTVFFKRGDTFYGTLTLIASGEPGNQILISAYGTGQNPILTGLLTLSSWTKFSGNIYYATLDVPRLNIVTLDSVVKGMGRFPDSGYLNYESHTGNTSITDYELAGSSDWTGAEIGIRKDRWELDRHIVTNHTGGTLTYNSLDDYGINSKNTPVDGNGYFFQNHIGCLDDLGDWSYDATANRIYMNFGGALPSSYTVKAGNLNNNMNAVNYINIENLTFEGSNKYGITIWQMSHVNITNCNFISQGGIAIVGDDCHYVQITDCTLTDVLNDGVVISHSNNITINGLDLTNIGMIPGGGKSGLGTYIGMSLSGDDLVVRNCSLVNVGYNGISFTGNNILIENNYIVNVCTVKDDGGGIYTISREKTYANRIIQNNIVLNSNGAYQGCEAYSAYEAWGKVAGIYLDEVSQNVIVTGNTVANMAWSGIFLHKVLNDQIINNTLYNNGREQLGNAYTYGCTGLTIAGNKLISKAASQLVYYHQSHANENPNVTSIYYDNNYARPIADDNMFRVIVSGISDTYFTFATWQAYTGQDLNSHKSNITTTDTTGFFKFFFNASQSNRVVSMEVPMIDIKGTKYINSVTLLPFTSVVLMVDPDPVQTVIFTIYPIPARESINILCNVTFSEPQIIRISDCTGKLCLETLLDPFANNIQVPINLKPGVYVVQVILGKTTLFNQKLIVYK